MAEIQVPVRGFVEGMSGVAQPPGTYSSGLNVRSRDEGSEQVGLTQRSGLEPFVSGLPDAPRELFLASRETPPYLWRELTTTPASGVLPAEVEEVWSSDARGEAHAVAQGFDGSLYVLRVDGSVDIFNGDGRYIETAECPIERGFTIVPRIQVDEDRAFYIAGVRTESFAGGAARLSRIRRRDDVYQEHWTVIAENPIADFCYTRNSIYLYSEPLPMEGGDDQLPTQRATLARVTGLFSSLPETAWVRSAPRPAWRVSPMSDGSCIISSPSNPLRNNAETLAFTDRGVSWTPRELDDWRTRVHAWVDGVVRIDGTAPDDGDPIERLSDARRFASDFAPTEDSTIRELVAEPNGDFDAPDWDGSAFGGLGGTRFGTARSMVTGPNRDIADLSLQESFIPGTATDPWALSFVVQIDKLALFGTTQYRLVTHAGDASATEFAMYVRVDLSGGNIRISIDDVATLGAGLITATTTVASNTLLVTIIHRGSGVNGALRLNGTHIGNIGWGTHIESGGGWDLGGGVTGPGPRTIFGRARGAADHNLADAATTFQILNIGALLPTQNANLLRDGSRIGGGGNRVKLFHSSGTPQNRLEIAFAGDPVTLDGFVTWTSNVGSQGKRVRVRALTVGFTSGAGVMQKEWIFDLDERSQFPARHWLDFEEQFTAEFWELELLDAYGSGADWGLTEVELIRRSEPQVLTLLEGVGADPILEGAPFALGEAIVVLDPTDPGAANGSGPVGSLPSAVSEIEAIEGYLAHRFGIAHQLPVDHPYTGQGNVPIGIGDDRRDQLAEIALNTTLPVLARVSPSSELLWAKNGAGLGLGAAEGPSGSVYTVGEAFPTTGDAMTTEGWGAWLRRWRDDGRDLDATEPPGWTQDAGTSDEALQLRQYDIGVDATGDLYLVRARADDTVTLERRQAEDGDAVFALAAPAGGRALCFLPAVGPILRNPGDSATTGPARAVGLFVGAEDALRAFAVMGQEAAVGVSRPRELEIVSIVGEDCYASDEDGNTALVASGVFPGGEIWTATGFGLTFIGNGRGYKVYDHEFRTLRSFEGSTRGEFPPRCRLGTFWNGRLWLGAGDNPRDWYMARWGEPYDMDFYPEVPDEAQPVSSQSSPIGPIPDTLRCLMPWTSDLAYVGCESSLFRIEGDPATDGRLVAVAPRLGVAFGQGSYCLDDAGNLYFYAAHGEVFTVRVGNGYPVSITDTRIGARLKDIDLAVFRPKLVWNTAERALHVFLLPRGNPLADIVHFTWQADFDAWHPDSYVGGAGRCVTAALTFDGDAPGDRTIALAFADGSVRKWGRYAQDDDGLVLPWHFVAGPLADPSLGGGGRMTSLHVVSLGDGEFEVGAWGSERAHQPGSPQGDQMHRMVAGQNGGISPTAAGAFLYVAARGTSRTTIQRITAGIVPAGRTRLQ